MTREEAESKLIELAGQMKEVLKDYQGKDFVYFTFCILEGGKYIHGNNDYFKYEDKENNKTIDFDVFAEDDAEEL